MKQKTKMSIENGKNRIFIEFFKTMANFFLSNLHNKLCHLQHRLICQWMRREALSMNNNYFTTYLTVMKVTASQSHVRQDNFNSFHNSSFIICMHLMQVVPHLRKLPENVFEHCYVQVGRFVAGKTNNGWKPL